MNSWQSCLLGDVVELKRGYDLPKQKRRKGTVPIVSSSGMTDCHAEAMVKAPGVITGRYGTLGEVFYIEEDYWPLNTTLYVRDFKGNHPRFIKYFLETINFFAYSDKAAVPGLNRNHLHQAPIVFPTDTTEQKRIASVLECLDDKIELNRRMNQTLEAMARAIFKDWFVDFGPTRAKIAGREPYLAPDLWKRFPDKLDDDGKPEGWQMGRAADVIDFNPRESLSKGVSAPYLDMASLPTIGATPNSPAQREFSSGTKFKNGDTLLARITPCLENGKTAFVQCLDENAIGWGSTEFIVMRACDPVPKAVSYILARDDAFRRHAIQSMTGTSGRQRARTEAISAYPIMRPDNDAVWNEFGRLIDPFFERMNENSTESEILSATRDLLLPELMSGNIQVTDASSREVSA